MEPTSRVRALLRNTPRVASLVGRGLPDTRISPDDQNHDPMRLGRFRLTREIARSSDIVYEAIDTDNEQRVAVKELNLPPSIGKEARRQRVDRFNREARAAWAIDHPNIVRIYEVGEERGRYYLAMEFLVGETLRSRMNSHPLLPEEEVVRIGIALCDALQYAHELGIVHRDIKPDNVFVREEPAKTGAHTLQVTLTDFGVARILYEETITTTGQFVGTVAYMSPEQLSGHHRIDARSDLFSLGIMLWEMVMGWRPFDSECIPSTISYILNEKTPIADNASPALQAVLQKATLKSPSQRYRTAAEMRNALQAIADDRVRTKPKPVVGSRRRPLTTDSAPVLTGDRSIPRASTTPASRVDRRVPYRSRVTHRRAAGAAVVCVVVAIGGYALRHTAPVARALAVVSNATNRVLHRTPDNKRMVAHPRKSALHTNHAARANKPIAPKGNHNHSRSPLSK